jgi:hypothetical protein
MAISMQHGPLSAFLFDQLGWRGTCFAYAAVQLGLMLPLYWQVLPSAHTNGERQTRSTNESGAGPNAQPDPSRPWLVFALLAASISLGWAISSVLSVHLLAILQAQGFELATAVALGVLVGPSQVGGRAAEMALGRRYRPVWTLTISVLLVASGLWLLATGAGPISAALMCYGAGAGIASIARGTLPLALFGANRYSIWMGRLAAPTLIAGAVSPALAAVLLERSGPTITLYVLAACALVNVVIALTLSLFREPE